MRKDMSRKVIERPRFKPHGTKDAIRKTRRRTDYENMPHGESLRRPHRANYTDKKLSDNLAPLLRYLDKQIGRPWDKVQSEMLERLDTRDPIQHHIFEHVDSHIAIKCQRVPLEESATGLVYHYAFGRSKRRWTVDKGQLFVCPETGIIKRAKALRCEVAVAKEKTLQHIDEDHCAFKLRGIWFMFEFVPYARVTREKLYPTPHTERVFLIDGQEWRRLPNHVNGETFWSGHDAYWFFHKPGVVVRKHKRQLNTRELRQYGLAND